MMSTMYQTIVFGPSVTSANSFWNEHTFHATERSACRHGIEQMPTPGVFGYVVIAREPDTGEWSVIDELGMGNGARLRVREDNSPAPHPHHGASALRLHCLVVPMYHHGVSDQRAHPP